ncbi:peptidoglycan-binding protein [Xanthomonas sp. A2111]|uniref:Peptidoglycan-binding protein n=1 Tax=Xanthomonas hawaiiensis TaxID=3003247 RepID=A0ABU2I5I5_9XANT|nr:peptidoglycan-binding protein [Xanthomonas sp. A2111]MBO9826958.1 peptidoglycan-binding protein [Xanthomonas sp. A2111]MDS9992898.1 peptidoglycan-binding protein [Xanthomonas sp. A2111]
MTDHKIVRLVSSEGKNRTLELEDGSVVTRSEGSVSWRNNNPGNLKFEFAGSADTTVTSTRTREAALAQAQRRYQGIVGLDQWGNAVFESYEAGRAAKIQLLERNHATHTVEQLLPSYSRSDYSGKTNHAAQADAIFAEGDRQGLDLRGKTVGQMTQAERGALADGIRRFEHWQVGETKTIRPSTAAQAVEAPLHPTPNDRPGSSAIYSEAHRHFFEEGRKYEYGRPDTSRPGRDHSRLERDLDGDGRLGVDCSAFVWRGLKNAGYDVPGNDAAGFTTSKLFNGSHPTPYAREHFDIVSAADARHPGGNLKQGDILMFAGPGGQHVGIFKGYDANGRIQFIGSQSQRGPDQQTIEPGGYWDGRTMHIVGALRAKPEFQVRTPLHGNGEAPAQQASTAPPEAHGAKSAAMADGMLKQGERGNDVEALQRQLNRMGVRDAQGKTLAEDGRFGEHTREAVLAFQKQRGLTQDGIVGNDTRAGLAAAEQAQAKPAKGPQLGEPGHPDTPLYDKMRTEADRGAEKANPPHAKLSNEAVANLTLQAKQAGIDSPDKLKEVNVANDKAFVAGTTPGFRAVVDLRQPTPPLEQTSAQLARQSAQQESVQREQQQETNRSMARA